MCIAEPARPFATLHARQADPAGKPVEGSRRHRIWDLPARCHCPLIGACLPIESLRRIVGQVAGGVVLADDYQVHIGSVAECSRRNPTSEALQRALDKRHAQAVQRFRQARSSEALFSLWVDAVNGGDVAGALWATLTHPRCDPALREQVCSDMHMLQHQAAAGSRADLARTRALAAQNAALAAQLQSAQGRSARLLAERDQEIRRQGVELMQLRAAMIGKDTMIASLRAECDALKASVPALESRTRLQEKLELLQARLARATAELAAHRLQRSQPAQDAAAPEALPHEQAGAPAAAAPLDLKDCSVLCVGGRSGSIASYRDLVEGVGGRFAHHDGGREDSARQLDATLAAADLVICQTGCISHHAYWRVKDHCKRHNKRCVFLDKPSISSLARGLGAAPAAALCGDDDGTG